jgi:hypothetical protein
MNTAGLLIFLIITIFVCLIVTLQRLNKKKRIFRPKKAGKSKNNQLELTEDNDLYLGIPSPPILNIPIPSVSLSSERGINYASLQDFLKNSEWEKADEETSLIFGKICGLSESNYIDGESMSQLPCTDLQTIDSLWLHYSNCRFGLTVQSQLFQASKENGSLFCEWVGWCKKGVCIRKSEITYDALTAPVGHLPSAYLPIVDDYLWIVLDSVSYMHQRLLYCQSKINRPPTEP